MKDFICAYFGKDWTITARGFGSAKDAEKHGLFMMPTAGVFGVAVIAASDNGWQLNLDRSMLSGIEKVIQDVLNNFKFMFA